MRALSRFGMVRGGSAPSTASWLGVAVWLAVLLVVMARFALDVMFTPAAVDAVSSSIETLVVTVVGGMATQVWWILRFTAVSTFRAAASRQPTAAALSLYAASFVVTLLFSGLHSTHVFLHTYWPFFFSLLVALPTARTILSKPVHLPLVGTVANERLTRWLCCTSDVLLTMSDRDPAPESLRWQKVRILLRALLRAATACYFAAWVLAPGQLAVGSSSCPPCPSCLPPVNDSCVSFSGFAVPCSELARIREFNRDVMPRLQNVGYRGIRKAMNERGFPGHLWHVGHACPDPSKKSLKDHEDFGWNLFAQHAVDNANLGHCLVSCPEAEHVGAYHVQCSKGAGQCTERCPRILAED